MPIEVELKARLAAPETTIADLRERAEGEHSTYSDTYYDWPDRRLEHAGRQELRLRTIETNDDSRCVWTFKGAMLNATSTPEYETIVSDAPMAHAILTGLGLEPTISYTKHCENFRISYGSRSILATVVRIPEIDGTFLEIEMLVPHESEIDDARRAIEAVLVELGLSMDDLESTFYVDLVLSGRSPRA
jgi:adenylate cyclase class 2